MVGIDVWPDDPIVEDAAKAGSDEPEWVNVDQVRAILPARPGGKVWSERSMRIKLRELGVPHSFVGSWCVWDRAQIVACIPRLVRPVWGKTR